MNKLKLALIGQGRSGRDIHGKFLKTESNLWFEVAAVVELDADRRQRALAEYPGCEVMEDYRSLFGRTDIDLVVNASFSDEHYAITKELLLNGFNVIVEKPMARNYFECSDLIRIAKEKQVTLAVFQQTFLAPYYVAAKRVAESGMLGEIKQVSIRFNGLSRRWDWQTTQMKMGGSVYNTGPHPIGIGLGFLEFDEHVRVEYSKLDLALTSGDAEDYAKIILSAPGKPVVDIEISSIDAFCDYNIKLQGTKGTYKCTTKAYQTKYIVDGENPEQPLIIEPLRNEEGLPLYCTEKLVTHEEQEKYSGSAFDVAVHDFYEMVYENLTKGTPLKVTPEQATQVIRVIETVHAENPLPKKY
ncbi:MAG: Gfo/Idh/MocA family oxidoreductase [Clostridia bacterium]|nr:Gfo/Idh/MocA family oxidoreductase [Clostridia bacterium]